MSDETSQDLTRFLAAHGGRYTTILEGNKIQFVFDYLPAARTFQAFMDKAAADAEATVVKRLDRGMMRTWPDELRDIARRVTAGDRRMLLELAKALDVGCGAECPLEKPSQET